MAVLHKEIEIDILQLVLKMSLCTFSPQFEKNNNTSEISLVFPTAFCFPLMLAGCKNHNV